MFDLYVCGYKGKGAGAGFIRWFTFGKFCHVSLVFDKGFATPTEIESIQGTGVHQQDFNVSGSYELFKVHCTEEQARIAFALARTKVGKKYDWFGIWSFVRRKSRQDPDKWFCSELVFWVLLKIGILLLRKKHWEVDPDMLCSSTVITPQEGHPKHWRN